MLFCGLYTCFSCGFHRRGAVARILRRMWIWGSSAGAGAGAGAGVGDGAGVGARAGAGMGGGTRMFDGILWAWL